MYDETASLLEPQPRRTGWGRAATQLSNEDGIIRLTV